MKYLWVTVFLLVLIWSAIEPKDYLTWFLEVSPAMLGALVLLVTYKKFRLTALVYFLLLLHAIILMVGGHFTYAEVPLFDWLRDIFSWQRNNYDKLGHFFQGFVPALLAREVVIRKKVFTSRAWKNFFIICFCLALSAFYELIEWIVAILSGESVDAFLGGQGYIWDTQSDMACALFGAVWALLSLARYHDKQLQKL